MKKDLRISVRNDFSTSFGVFGTIIYYLFSVALFIFPCSALGLPVFATIAAFAVSYYVPFFGTAFSIFIWISALFSVIGRAHGAVAIAFYICFAFEVVWHAYIVYLSVNYLIYWYNQRCLARTLRHEFKQRSDSSTKSDPKDP